MITFAEVPSIPYMDQSGRLKRSVYHVSHNPLRRGVVYPNSTFVPSGSIRYYRRHIRRTRRRHRRN